MLKGKRRLASVVGGVETMLEEGLGADIVVEGRLGSRRCFRVTSTSVSVVYEDLDSGSGSLFLC
jgi:hypothetical protein